MAEIESLKARQRAVEDLQPVVLPIRHQHTVLAVDPDGMGRGEFAVAASLAPPGQLMLAVGREAVHGAVAIAVGHEDAAVRRHRHVRGVVERCLEPRPMPFAEPTDLHALGGEDQDLMGIAVDQKDPTVGADGDAVRVEAAR